MARPRCVLRTAILAVSALSMFSTGAAAQEYRFTTCGATGAFGPTQAMCDAAYGETPLEHGVTIENGIQNWRVPVSGVYRITATGAQGASPQLGLQGGRGTRMGGEFYLLAGTILRVVVGQVGMSNGRSGSGGGGSFVVDSNNLLIVAGGGGGTRVMAGRNGCDASPTTFGVTGSGLMPTSNCDVKQTDNGLGGKLSLVGWGSAGAGFFGNGADDLPWGSGGKSWANGMYGGAVKGCSLSPLAQGGFGGGGTGEGCAGGGGGGGYSGGDGGYIAGGGGSFNVGQQAEAFAGVGVGNGNVAVELLLSDVTPPVVVFDVVPPSLSNSADAEFAFSASEPATLTCQLDGGTALPCNTTANQGVARYSGLSEGPHTLTVSATDAALNSGQSQYSWTIDIVAPSLVSVDALPNPSPINTAIVLTAVWSGASSASYSIDGSNLVEMTSNAGTFTANLGAFTQAGVHDVCVHGRDAAGNSEGAQCLLLAVYDPNAGFVTGGGWIVSGPGAFIANPVLTGKANFGFVVKYHKGAKVPSGNTEFHFQLGNLVFQSSTYEWLVVGGSRAQFKGSGTVNGDGNYGFALTANDGAVEGGASDKLRMKIWDKATGAVVYDNQDTTPLGGGNIAIHSPKK